MLLHLMARSKEDAETVTAFFEDMKWRDLDDPLLVTSDGRPASLRPLRCACRVPLGNAVLPIACAILRSRSRKTCGLSSGSACRQSIRSHSMTASTTMRHGRLRSLYRTSAIPGDASVGHSNSNLLEWLFVEERRRQDHSERIP